MAGICRNGKRTVGGSVACGATRVAVFAMLVVLSVSCGKPEPRLDALARSKVDAMNKVSFKERFHDARLSEAYARKAIGYIDDSLPQYDDGRLRAWNNIATAYYNRAVHDSAAMYADSVLAFRGHADNADAEKTLARLLTARLRQRQCDIAGSYRILYEVEQSGLLDEDGGGWLYSLAKSEFYITTMTLNYHYRNKPLYRQAELLVEMENRRPELHCDYAEDMMFNYALAYGYYALCDDSARRDDYLHSALYYCAENLRLLDNERRYSTYHLANTYQILGFMLWSPAIGDDCWRRNAGALAGICDHVSGAFGFDAAAGGDTASLGFAYDGDALVERRDALALSFLRESTALFFLTDDPYQRLGAVVSTGRFCMAHGDTATARDYFNEVLFDTSMFGVAPKFEAMLYEGFLTAGCATSLDEVAEWTRRELSLLEYIKQNEKADFLLQKELMEVRQRGVAYLVFAIALAVLAVALVVTIMLLRRRTKALQREKAQLQAAKQQDVERIANVETCLSVMRHDVTPFVSYLQNDRLPEELKREVLGQLLRTFDNIKSWTNLSIPSGLQFRGSVVHLQEVFDSLEHSVGKFHQPAVEVAFAPTSLAVVGDRQLLEIMLRNLVNNALQHTDEGSVRIAAEVCDGDNRFVQVSVSDTGSGMDADEVEGLFRVDKKLRPSEGGGGYGRGFGLILCRYIIKKHDDNTLRGCRIWAESEKGKGSTFRFLVQRGGEQ